MKKINRLKFLFLTALISFISIALKAQDITVDEILDGYFENTGGKEKWMNLKGIKMIGKLNQGGMEIPLEIVYFADGRQYTKFSLQGTDFYQSVYDGETLWSVNFQNMKAEKSDKEATDNFKLDINDFPESFLNYKEKGYTAEIMGTETIDGTEAYKIKLIKEPKTIDGKEVEDISYYFFDNEAFILLAQESTINQGPGAGKINQSTMSDYLEVDGLYFPFSLTQGIKGGQSQPLTIDSIETNPDVNDEVFKYSGDN